LESWRYPAFIGATEHSALLEFKDLPPETHIVG